VYARNDTEKEKKRKKNKRRGHVGFDATMTLGLGVQTLIGPIVGASTGFDWNPWAWLQVDPQT
jgi:hypothetical protein